MPTNLDFRNDEDQLQRYSAHAVASALAHFGFSLRGIDIFSFDDLVQEVQLRLVSYGQQNEVREPGALIWSIARSVVADAGRRSRYREHSELNPSAIGNARTSDPALNHEEIDDAIFHLQGIRNCLPSHDREVFDYFAKNGLDISSTLDRKWAASQLGVSDSAMRQSIFRIRRTAVSSRCDKFEIEQAKFWSNPSIDAGDSLLDRCIDESEAGPAHWNIASFCELSLFPSWRREEGMSYVEFDYDDDIPPIEEAGRLINGDFLHSALFHAKQARKLADVTQDALLRAHSEWQIASVQHYEALRERRSNTEIALRGFQRASGVFLSDLGPGITELLGQFHKAEAFRLFMLGDKSTSLHLLQQGQRICEDFGYQSKAADIEHLKDLLLRIEADS